MADKKTPAPIKIHVTGQSAYPGDPLNSYIMTQEPRPNILQRAVGAIGDVFASLLPDRGGKSETTDDALTIKTSPTIWEYEMFRQEWDRRTVLRDIEMIMKADPRIKRANRVFAATAVRKGISVTVTSTVSDKMAAKAQDVVDQVMRDAQVNAKLASWARILLKDGDLFLNPVVDTNTRRIKTIKRLPALSMQRNDDMMSTFQDLSKAFRQIDPISLAVIEDFPLWSMNHIRWDHEEGERYGNSQYLQIRGYWKKLNMTEEDLVVRRRTRAIPRRLHNVGTKDNAGSWPAVEEYKAKNALNAKTSQITTDYYGNGLVDIKSLDGDAQLDHIKDVEHLQEVYMIGTSVPLHILGFGKIGAGADMIEAQKRQFMEDTQELRDLIEFGDSSPYSGLRFIFDFALALQGIDPKLVSYNISWFAADMEGSADRVERVIKLRSAQPKPLCSQRLALQTIARDLNLEDSESIDNELAEIEAELEVDREDQETLKESLNPESPSTAPLSRSTVTKSMTDAAAPTSKKKAHPLRSARFRGLEKRARTLLKRQGRLLLQEIGLPALAAKFEHLTDPEQRKGMVEAFADAFNAAAARTREARAEEWAKVYRAAAAFAGDVVKKEVRQHSSDVIAGVIVDAPTWEELGGGYVNPETIYFFQNDSGTRITNIDATTLANVRSVMARCYEDGEEFPEWIKQIQGVVNCSYIKDRAEMIARTELSWAYNTGILGLYKDLGIERVRWLAVMDNRTCERCAEKHERTFLLTEVDGNIPAHPRCRCTVVAADAD